MVSQDHEVPRDPGPGHLARVFLLVAGLILGCAPFVVAWVVLASRGGNLSAAVSYVPCAIGIGLLFFRRT